MTGYLPVQEAVRLDDLNRRGGRSPNVKPAKFKVEPFDAVRIGEEPEHIVRDIIPARGLILDIGEPGSGKSFVAADLGLHVAMGKAWAGKAVRQGVVVYVTGEGASGFRKRLTAFRQQQRPAAGTPFYLIADAPDLGHRDGDAAALISRIREQIESPIALIVLDTLATMMRGADENSTGDASLFIDNCARIIAALDCAVLVVHHLGKDAAKGARGSSVLKAAADAEITINGTEGERTATVTKSKDGEAGQVLTFTLERVEIEGAHEASSCVLQVVEGWQHSLRNKVMKVTGPAKIALDALQLAIDEAGELPPTTNRQNRTKRAVRASLWRGYCERLQISETDTPDSKRKAFKRAAYRLQAIGKIGVWDEWVWIND
jgi:RecA-family ATPase